MLWSADKVRILPVAWSAGPHFTRALIQYVPLMLSNAATSTSRIQLPFMIVYEFLYSPSAHRTSANKLAMKIINPFANNSKEFARHNFYNEHFISKADIMSCRRRLTVLKLWSTILQSIEQQIIFYRGWLELSVYDNSAILSTKRWVWVDARCWQKNEALKNTNTAEYHLDSTVLPFCK